jgi:hypothetical protein
MLNLVRTTLFLVIVTLVVQSANAQDKYHIDVREYTWDPVHRTYDIDIRRDTPIDFGKYVRGSRDIPLESTPLGGKMISTLFHESNLQHSLQRRAFEYQRQLHQEQNDATLKMLRLILAEQQRQEQRQERERKRKAELANKAMQYSIRINSLPKPIQPDARQLLEAHIIAYQTGNGLARWKTEKALIKMFLRETEKASIARFSQSKPKKLVPKKSKAPVPKTNEQLRQEAISRVVAAKCKLVRQLDLGIPLSDSGSARLRKLTEYMDTLAKTKGDKWFAISYSQDPLFDGLFN